MTEATSHHSDYDEWIQPLVESINRFLAGEYDYPEFQRQFKSALKSYKKSIRDRPYWPLELIADIPRHLKSNLRDYCEEALERLPKEALDRSTRYWVGSTLIVNEGRYSHYSFCEDDGQSRFGTHAALYSTCIDQDSFLLSALNGTITPPPFRYSSLLTALREIGGNELATWVYGTEPDNAFAKIDHVRSLGNVYEEPAQLQRLERHPAPEGGGSYLMLLPKSKQWLLLTEYDDDRLSICLHGHRRFIAQVAAHINVEPDWERRFSDD